MGISLQIYVQVSTKSCLLSAICSYTPIVCYPYRCPGEMACYIKTNIDNLRKTQKPKTIIHAEAQISIFNFAELVSLKKSVVNTGIKIYNKLPSQMRKLKQKQHFMRELRSFSLQRTFYSIDKYVSLISRILMFKIFALLKDSFFLIRCSECKLVDITDMQNVSHKYF